MLDALTIPSKHRDISAALQAANDEAVQLEKRRNFIAAEVILRRAITEAPESAPLWTNLGCMLLSQRKLNEARSALELAIKIDETYAVAWSNLGLVFEGLKDFTKARTAFRRALKINPSYLNAQWNRSLLDLGVGRYRQGFDGYDSRLLRKPGDYPRQPAPFWEGQSLEGKTIFVCDEQGIGDTILFSRFLPKLASLADKVFLYLPPPRMALLWEFRRCCELIPGGVPAPKTDYQTYLGSLPRWLGATPIPAADPNLYIRTRVDVEMARENPILLQKPTWEGALKVGIRWSGNPNQEVNAERSVPVEELVRACGSNPRVWLYSLQEGAGSDDLAKFGLDGNVVYNLSSRLTEKGLAGLGSVMLQLDLVITCCTSVAHLAGALGVPCIVLLHHIPYWVWGYGDKDTSPWYPKTKLLRQQSPGDWTSVLNSVSNTLKELH